MTQGPEPDLAELLARARADTEAAVTRMQEATREFEAEARAQRADLAEEAARRAEQARAGELGPQARTLQQRVDLGETTWQAVLSGRDGSPEAGEARAQATRNAETFAEDVDDALRSEREAGREDARAEAIEALAALRRSAAAAIAEHSQGGRRGQ